MGNQNITVKMIYLLKEINSEYTEKVGPKASHLGDLIQAGFNVPDGIVLTPEFFTNFLLENRLSSDFTANDIYSAKFSTNLTEILTKNLNGLSNSEVAIRSSAIDEDLPDLSFAGMYETFLNINGFEEILQAIKKCWISTLDRRIDSYNTTNKFSSNKTIAVIIQKQINSTSAGVLFTVNPVTGNPNELKINSTKGLGEQLVSGNITADEWTVNENDIIQNFNSQNSLSRKQVKLLGAIGKDIEKFYSKPQDIEWAFENKNLYILQTRPITKIPEYIDWTPKVSGGWMRHFRLGEWLGEPVTPLFATWLLQKLDSKIFENLDHVTKVPSIKPFNQIINGWYYAQGNFVPRTLPKFILFGLRYMMPAMLFRRRRVGIIIPSMAYWSLKLYEQEWREKYRPEYIQKVNKYTKEIEQSNIKELLNIIEDISDSAGDNFYSFICVGGSAWKPEALLAEFYKKILQDKIGGNYQLLLQSIGITDNNSYDHQVTNLDWYYPTIGELDITFETKENTETQEKSINERLALESKIKTFLKANQKQQKKFNKLLNETRDSAILREEQVGFITLGWPVMRKALLKIGEELITRDILEKKNDIFFLEYQELVDCINNISTSVSLQEVVTKRKVTWENQKLLSPPDILGKLSPFLLNILGKYQTIMGSNHEEKGNGIYGMPASPGRVEGFVRIITSPSEFQLLQKGEILVAPMTGPAWTPLFTLASGVVTDTGSILAHASLIAREYGIPAVVGTGKATKVLHSGDKISLDGNTGEICLLEESK